MKPLIFIHIPKAGGTTLVDIFRQNYKRHQMARFDGYENLINAIDSSKIDPNKFKLIYGHFSTGLDQHLSCDLNYFTFFRDPVQRVVSHYDYVKRSPGVQAYQLFKDVSIQDFVSKFSSRTGNLQSRLIAGINQKGERSSEELFHEAKQKLSQKFISFGILEHFDESMVLLKNKLGWTRTPMYVRQNVCSNKMEIDKETQELIAHYNKADVNLYNFALEKFQREIENKEDFSRQLQKMKMLNRCYRPYGQLYSFARSKYLQVFHGAS